jgi:hypothetical protein
MPPIVDIAIETIKIKYIYLYFRLTWIRYALEILARHLKLAWGHKPNLPMNSAQLIESGKFDYEDYEAMKYGTKYAQ